MSDLVGNPEGFSSVATQIVVDRSAVNGVVKATVRSCQPLLGTNCFLGTSESRTLTLSYDDIVDARRL